MGMVSAVFDFWVFRGLTLLGHFWFVFYVFPFSGHFANRLNRFCLRTGMNRNRHYANRGHPGLRDNMRRFGRLDWYALQTRPTLSKV